MKKVLKKIVLLFTVCICFAMFCGFDENQVKVYDDGDLLTDTQEETLQEDCIELAKNIKMDIIIVTTDSNYSKSTTAYADDFFDEHNFGYEDDKKEPSGVLFLIDMTNREIYVSTAGFAISCISDDDIDDILDDVYPYVKNQDYYNACNKFITSTKYVIEHGDIYDKYYEKWDNYSGTADSFYNKYIKKGILDILKSPFVDLAAALLIATIVLFIMVSANKSKMTANGNTYMDKNKFRFHTKRDIFVRTTTVRHKIQKNNGGGGGSSIHHSSGGFSHGGGGRKF